MLYAIGLAVIATGVHPTTGRMWHVAARCVGRVSWRVFIAIGKSGPYSAYTRVDWEEVRYEQWLERHASESPR